MTSARPPEPTPVEVLSALLGEHDDEPGAARPLPTRPRPGDRRGDRAGQRTGRRRPPPPVAVVRAIAGAALSVCAVALGLVVLLQLDRSPERVSAVSAPAAAVPPPTPPSTPAPPPAPRPAAPAPLVQPSPVPTLAPPPSQVVPVTVLNNSRRSKLAARSAERFAAGGWPVVAVGNFRGRIPVTTVYYDPGLEASARAFAARFDGIVRVRPRFATLPARGVVVVLTREFAA